MSRGRWTLYQFKVIQKNWSHNVVPSVTITLWLTLLGPPKLKKTSIVQTFSESVRIFEKFEVRHAQPSRYRPNTQSRRRWTTKTHFDRENTDGQKQNPGKELRRHPLRKISKKNPQTCLQNARISAKNHHISPEFTPFRQTILKIPNSLHFGTRCYIWFYSALLVGIFKDVLTW